MPDDAPILFLTDPLSDGTLMPGVYVLLDNPDEPGAMLRLATAAEDLETGQIVASDEVHQVHRDYLECFKPLDPFGHPKPIYSEHLPSTVEEAVQIVLDLWPADMRGAIRDIDEDDLIEFHMSIGATFRNEFELWFANGALLMDCGTPIPDEASMVILKAVWEALQRLHD